MVLHDGSFGKPEIRCERTVLSIISCRDTTSVGHVSAANALMLRLIRSGEEEEEDEEEDAVRKIKM